MQTWLTTRFDHTIGDWSVCRVTTEPGKTPTVDVLMSGYETESDAAAFMQKYAEVQKTVNESLPYERE
jgi:hypothetical protein